jgi:hypothetical protein
MDWNAAIEKHCAALKCIVAELVAMVGLGHSAIVSRQSESANAADSLSDCLLPTADCRVLLPRHLHRAVLRLLRPAESAARRLVIALARGLAPTVRPRKPSPPRKAKASSLLVRDGVGTGIVLRPGAPIPAHLAHLVPSKAAPRPLSFPLLDPLPRWRGRRRWQPAAGTPRISMAGVTERLAIPVWRPPLPDDPLDAGRLGRRLAALSSALDDLPGQAKRFARWKARRDRALGVGRIHRVTPLRGGRPPGGRLARYDPDAPRRQGIRDVDEILAHAHALARHALRPDTS